MSIRFAIKTTAAKAETESDGTIIRFSGTSEPFYKVSERYGETIGEDDKGHKVFRFVTGLILNK